MTAPVIRPCSGPSCSFLAVSATLWWSSVIILMFLFFLSGVGEAQSTSEAASCRSQEFSPRSKSFRCAEPHCSPRPFYCLRSCTDTRCDQTCAPCPTPQQVRFNLHYIKTNLSPSGWPSVFMFVFPCFRPNPKHPPTLPKPCILANVKYSSWDFSQKGPCCVRH